VEPFAHIEGFGIHATDINGDTSGRFTAAQIVARVFPVERAFVDRIEGEGFLPAKEFPAGPFSNDLLTYRGDHILEFETPAMAQGVLRQNENGGPPVLILQSIARQDSAC
jgi:hypothetical protein